MIYQIKKSGLNFYISIPFRKLIGGTPPPYNFWNGMHI